MPALEFLLDPLDVSPLARWPGMRASRTFPAEITWLDTEDGALSSDKLVLAVRRGGCQITKLHPALAVQQPALMADAIRPELLDYPLPSKLVARAQLHGKQQTLRHLDGENEPVELRLIEGRVDRIESITLCRVTLEGRAVALAPLALALAEGLNLQVPRWGMAEQALAVAQGEQAPPRALGAPQLPDGRPVSESLTTIAAHLTDVMLHWADRVPTSRTPEAVHQMRVATRRLRSALSIYKDVAACPEIAGLIVPLKLCAARLGTARDWDVFLEGIGARLADTFPGDARCAAMLRAAARRRRAAYTEVRTFLTGPDFRVLTVALACATALRPWEGAAPDEGLQQDTADFAAGVLGRRLRAVRKAGRKIERLSVPALHELRKKCKRLRYAAEFFAPLFPHKLTRRFIARLAELQEELGLLNDSAAVSGLMAQLGRLERSYAAGLVEGFSAAGAGPARTRIHHAWKRFRGTSAFFPH